jgi:hypothetical protein
MADSFFNARRDAMKTKVKEFENRGSIYFMKLLLSEVSVKTLYTDTL